MHNTFNIDIIPPNDPQRVAALHRYRLLDSPREKVFDNITSLATEVFSMPIALISLVDAETVFFKSTVGVGNVRCVDRGESLCALAILNPGVMVFEDALQSDVLSASNAVHGPAKVRFYAGAPLKTADGFLIGTVCVVDHQPHEFGEQNRMVLKRLANVAMEQMELRLAAMTEIEEQQRIAEEKQEFISVASHELRTPVTSLTSSLQLLDRMKEKPGPNFFRLIEQANRSITKLNKLINDLLDVNRLSAGHPELCIQPFTLAELVRQSCSFIELDGKHQLMVSGNLSLMVNADQQKIEQVLVNLVSNAVKYAPMSREVEVIIEALDGKAQITVADKGPGISPAEQDRLFDRYYRGTDAAQYHRGLGLGLYISAGIVRRHGGSIGIISEPGKGSRFWFTLPF